MKRAYLITGLLAAIGAAIYLLLNIAGDEKSLLAEKKARASKRGHDTWPALMPDKIDRIDIRQKRWEKGSYREEAITLQQMTDGRWHLTDPVEYPVNTALMRDILESLGAMKTEAVEPFESADYRRWQLDDQLGIDVTVYMASKPVLHFIVGAGDKDTTYIRQAERAAIYRASSLHRKPFARSPNQWRDRTITGFDKGSISRVSYRDGNEVFTMTRNVAADAGAGRLEPVGAKIENFDSESAASKIEALANLHAGDFCDQPLLERDGRQRETQGALWVTVDAKKNGEPVTVELTFGKKDEETGLHYLTTSDTTQIFLVSSHLKPLFRATPRDFERTEEQVQQYKLWREKAKAHREEHNRRRKGFTQTR